MQDKLIKWLIRKLLIYKFKHEKEKSVAWSFGVDEHTDIDILLNVDGIQGTRIPNKLIWEYYHKDNEWHLSDVRNG